MRLHQKTAVKSILLPSNPSVLGANGEGRGSDGSLMKDVQRKFFSHFSPYTLSMSGFIVSEKKHQESAQIRALWCEQMKWFSQKSSLSTMPNRLKRFGGYLGHLHCGGRSYTGKDPSR